MTKKESFSLNLLAIKEILNSHVEKRTPNREILANFQGYGGLKEILNDPYNDDAWTASTKTFQTDVKQLYDLVKSFSGKNQKTFESMIQSLKSSTLTAYFTPDSLIEAIVPLVLRPFNGQEHLKILEPSCGKGDFIKSILNHTKAFSDVTITAVEKDSISSAITKGLYPAVNVHRSALEAANLDTNYYDLVISNIPFGNYKVYDPSFKFFPKLNPKIISQHKIHTYFFIKGLDLTRKNGLLVFITTTGVADSVSNELIRTEMIKEASLISAIRLDNETFLHTGTKANTDILIFQRRDVPIKNLISGRSFLSPLDENFLRTVNLDHYEGGQKYSTTINSVFSDGSELGDRVLGQVGLGYMFDRKQIIYAPYPEEIDQLKEINILLQKDLSSIILQKKTRFETQQLDLFSSMEINELPEAKKPRSRSTNQPLSLKVSESFIAEYGRFLKQGSIIVVENIPGKLNFGVDGPEIIPLVHKNESELHKYKLAAEILLTYKNLLYHDSEKINVNLSYQLRSTLNTLYDQFNETYGFFHDPKNKYFVDLEPDAIQLLGIELYNEKSKGYDKSDIFTKSNFQLTLAKTLSIEDSITSSLNQFGFVSLDHISKISNTDEATIIKHCLQNDLLFPDPIFPEETNFVRFTASNEIAYRWVTKDDFLAGPLRHKIKQIEQCGGNIYAGSPDKAINHLELLRKHDLPFLSIEDIDPQLGEQWIPDSVYYDFLQHFFQTDQINFQKSHSTGAFNVSVKQSNINTTEYRVDCISGHRLYGNDLLEYAMSGNKPVIKYSVSFGDTKKSFLDKQATTSASLKIDAINQAFTSYIQSHDEYSPFLENLYNNTQNVYVNKIYSGAHLQLTDLEHFELKPHQKDGVWQTVSNNGSLNDHIVGAGKSLIMICSAMEMKRLGVSNKTLLIGLKANTSKIYDEFMLAYPNARVLCPDEKDFTPSKRTEFFHKMMNNDWDCVIMTHEQFSAIPQSREIQIGVIEKELDNIDLDLYAARGDDSIDRRVLRGLETRKLNMKASLDKLSDSLRKDPNMITFDKLGFGHLMVDESHEFKNLSFTTRFNRVAGLGNPEGSARALNLLFAIRTIQDQYRDDKGVTFCSGTPISNSLVELYSIFKYLTPSELERRGMTNFDSWARTYAKMSTEYELSVTNEIKVKERFRTFVKVPELAAWYRSFANIANDDNIVLDKPQLIQHLVEIEPTHTQEVFAQDIIRAVQTEDFSFVGKHFSKAQLLAKMLIATNLASKMSLDMRAIEPTYSVNDGSKLLRCAENIATIYNATGGFKGTQLVFCDIQTPSGKDADLFNVYDALKELLTSKYAIPAEEIQFIHDHDATTVKKNKFFSAINSGHVRITMGSTKKMGVGVNVQERVVAMHHLDIPWTPKDIEQRNGRGGRQGNFGAKEFNNNTVDTFFYATRGTLDAYRYFLVDLKQSFINQIKAGEIKSRTIDEGDIDGDGSMSPAAFIARLSGKEELLQKSKIDQKISDVQTKITVLKTDKQKAENNIKRLTELIPKSRQHLEKHKIDKLEFEKTFILDKEAKPLFTFIDRDIILTERKVIGEHISRRLESLSKAKKYGKYLLGEIGKFNLMVSLLPPAEDENKGLGLFSCFHFSTESTLTEMSYSTWIGSSPPPGTLARHSYDCLKDIGATINRYNEAIAKMESDLEFDTTRLPTLDINRFDKELENLLKEAKRLNDIIEQSTPAEKMSPLEEAYNIITDQGNDEFRTFLKKSKFSAEILEELKLFLKNHPTLSKGVSSDAEEIISRINAPKSQKKERSI